MLTFRPDSNFYANGRLLAIGTEGFKPNIYYDTLGIPTTGYGYALVFKQSDGSFKMSDKLVSEFSTIGITLTTANTTALNAIAKSLSDGNVSTAKSQVTALDAQVADINITQADTLFTYSYGRAMDDVKTAFKTNLGAVNGDTLFTKMANTTEMIAITDIAYNGSSSLIGLKLSTALWNQNRAEAWYEIRYDTNGGASVGQGIANRRYVEALKFSLYDDQTKTNVTLAEANQTAQMYTSHRLGILDYETKYNPVAADNNYSPKPGIQDIYHELQPAATALETAYLKPWGLSLGSINPLNIQISYDNHPDLIGEDTIDHTGYVNDLLIGDTNINTLQGQAGNDILLGLQGNDVLSGGDGNDTLIGGADMDTLIGDS